MSISTNHYIVFGWKLPYDFVENIWDDKFLPYIEGHEGIEFSMIADGMCGDYIVFGTVIKLPSSHENKDFMDIDLSIMYVYNTGRLQNEFQKVFGKRPTIAPKLFSFIHYN